MGFLMIPVTTLYDEYIDRSKLSEQKNIAGRIPEATRSVKTSESKQNCS